MWDWTDGEKDNDLTKSYPFPVPRIRDLSSEFAMPSCVQDLDYIPSDEDSMAAPLMHNNTEVPMIREETVTSQEPMSDDRNTNDLQSSQVAHKPKKQYITYNPKHMTNDERIEISSRSLPRYRYTGPHLRSRRFTDVKSIVAEPPDANQDDVYKARFKLQSRHQSQALQA